MGGSNMNQSLWLTGVAVLLATLGGAITAEEPPKIEGRWKVTTVELAGMPVPGLEDAELVFADGKKVFTLPGGRIEKGTYQLDAAKRPGEIDVTTEGKDGTEKGIYVVDGETLKLCLATAGGKRSTEFATKKDSDQILIVLRRADPKPSDDKPAQKPTGERGFHMGFTGFVHDTTLEAVTASRKFCRENGDIIAHHIEGVPWAEVLTGQPFPKAMLEEWEGKKSATPKGGKVYLAISPGRGDLQLAEKALPLPKELKGKAYDDPLVKKAFLSYCQRSIEFFKPDYLGIGIEVNEIYSAGPGKWTAYVELHKYVYDQLKKEHKDLPIFASFTLHNMFKQRGKMLSEFQALMPYNDVVAVSYYPFFVDDKDRPTALDWLTENFDSFRKPYAMVETHDAAEQLSFRWAAWQPELTIEGTPTKQLRYNEKLLALAQKRNFAFVVSFIHQDYDALWERIKATAPGFFVAWRDCGLLDETGKPRPAYNVWRTYFELPFQPKK